MHHFRVEHRRVVALALVDGDGERRVLRGADDGKTFGQFGDPIAMAHPHRIAAADLPDAVEQRAGFADMDIGTAELAGVATLDGAAELQRQRLLAVADGEYGNTGVEY